MAFASNLVASKKGGWKELKKVWIEKQKKSCTIFHHGPFSIYEKLHGIRRIRAISLWRNTWKKYSLRSLKYHRIEALAARSRADSTWHGQVTNSCAIHFFVFKLTSCFEFGSLGVCVCVTVFVFAECLVLQCSNRIDKGQFLNPTNSVGMVDENQFYMGVSENRGGYPKMDGENNGKPN